MVAGGGGEVEEEQQGMGTRAAAAAVVEAAVEAVAVGPLTLKFDRATRQFLKIARDITRF